MKNFKKFLSAALSVALIAVTAVGGIGATAETSESEGSESAAIKATPVSNWTRSVAWWQYSTKTEIQPLGFINAKGFKVKLSKNADIDNFPECLDYEITEFYGQKGYLGFDFAETKYNPIADTEGWIFYVKTDSANYILPKLELINETNQGEYHLKKGSNYYYAALGSSTWQTGTALAGSSDVNYNFKGVISFESAFEGYVKIPYSSMGNDGGRVMNTENDKTKVIGFNFAKLGGDYGTVSIGPVMLITEDSTSTKIEVPESWSVASVKLKDIGTYTSLGNRFNLNIENVNITSGVLKGEGITISSDKEYVFDGSATDNSKNLNKAPEVASNLAAIQNLGETNGFVFYVKVDKANKISPEFKFNPEFSDWGGAYLKMNAAYYTMPINGVSWNSANAGRGCINEPAFGTIALEEGFEGYVKIPYTSLYNSHSSTPIGTLTSTTAQNYNLNGVCWRAVNVGNGYSYTVGQIYLVKEDSSSPEMEIVYDPISAKAITRYEMKHFNWRVTEEVTNISSLGLKGVSLKSKNDVTKTATSVASTAAYSQMQFKNATDKWEIGEDGSGAYNGKHFELPNTVKTSGALIMYVKTTAANKMALLLKTKGNYNYFETSGMKKDAAYYTCPTGGTGWQLHTSTESIDDGGDKGLIEFDGAFEGYVKIPASSVQWNGTTPIQIGRIEIKFLGLGGDYGDEIIMSPLMYTEQDSPSTTINITKAFEDGDVDRSGVIDSADLALCRQYLLTSNLKPSNVEATGGDADANYDGVADILDLVRLKKVLVNKAG